MGALWFRTRLIACLLGLVAFGAARPAAAETLTVMWDASPDGTVSGYVVYVRMPGAQGSSYDVGQTTSFDWNGAVDGQQYYFSVASYRPGPVIGVRSTEISRYPETAPSLANPGSQSSVAGSPTSLQLIGTDADGSPLTYGASGLPPGLVLNAGTGFISGSPTAAGSFVVTASVTDGGSSNAKTFTWTVLPTGSPAALPTSPTAPLTQPTTLTPQPGPAVAGPSLNNPGAQSTARGATVNLRLSAYDSDGGAVLTFGASGLPPGLRVERGNGQISGSPTTTGNYLVTATVTDGVLSDAKTFTWTINQPAFDTTAPVVTITLPTAASSFTTDQVFVTLAGTATDDTRVAQVAWSSDRGPAGTASGTDTWIAGVPVVPGSNTITIVARDEAGNITRRAIVVKARIDGTVSSPAVGKQRGKRTDSAD